MALQRLGGLAKKVGGCPVVLGHGYGCCERFVGVCLGVSMLELLF